MAAGSVRVVVADDHEVVRCGLVNLLDGTDVEIVAEASSGEAADNKSDRQLDRERRKDRDRHTRKIARLEELIAEQEAEKAALTEKLAEPEVYGDPGRIQAIQGEESEVDARIEAAYGEWESLSEALAEIEAVLEN